MNNNNAKSLLLVEILSSPWSTSDYSEDNVKLTGRGKADTIEINVSEIDLIAKMLENENPKIQIGAVKVIGFFGQHANPYIKQISKNFEQFDEKEQIEIIHSLRRIGTKEALIEIGLLIESKPTYDVLFDTIYYLSELFDDFPVLGLSTILKCSNNKDMWTMLKGSFRDALIVGENPNRVALNDLSVKLKREPPIGISQKMEKDRIQLDLTMDRITETMITVFQLEKSDKKDERKVAKKLLKEIKSLVKD